MSEINEQHTIPFSPPDITQAEIDAVAEALRSGWITTGPRTKELEAKLRDYTGAAGLACLNSATAALEGALRICGIGPGDEVIVPAYTYSASAAVVEHVGASLVLVDVAPGSFFPSAEAYVAACTPRTKAIIAVDIAGVMADYDALFAALESYTGWQAANELQACFTRPIVIADAAHALGATRGSKPAGSVADFTAFSFHAVKNFTTAEGGALAWRDFGYPSDELYRQVMLYSLHGQTKDALHKEGVGNWEYDIEYPGYKCNMTDVQAALGLAQFERYPQLLARRRELVQMVEHYLDTVGDTSSTFDPPTEGAKVQLLKHFTPEYESSAHLMLTRVAGATEEVRNAIIAKMGEAGITCNVHYKPLPMLTAYKNLGFNMADFPHAYAQYENEITLPLHTLLTNEDVVYICEHYIAAIKECW